LNRIEGRSELFERSVAVGLTYARVPHRHVTAYIKVDGLRLSELSAHARMTLPATSKLVDDLQRLGTSIAGPTRATGARS